MKETQVIIIGGGLQGLATANALLDKGQQVILLERGPKTAMETSYANAGMLTPSQAQPWNSISDILEIFSGMGKEDSAMLIHLKAIPSLFFWGLRFIRNSSKSKFYSNTENICKLAKYSLELTKKIREDNKLLYDHSEKGTMKIFRSDSAFSRGVEQTKLLSKLGIKYELLDSIGVSKKEPKLKDIKNKLVGGIFFPEDETGDAHKFCNHLEDLIRKKGGRIHTNTEVKKILVNKGSVNSVVTDRVEIQATRVVIAAGSWSYFLSKTTGLRIPVRPVKGYSLTLELENKKDLPTFAVLDESFHSAITPLGNRLRTAGTAEFVGFNDSINEKRIDYLNNVLRSIYPSLFFTYLNEKKTIWYGFRPMSPDGLPYLGPTKIKGLYLNTGHGHLGWTLAMGSSVLLSDMIVGKDPDIDPSPYLVRRTV